MRLRVLFEKQGALRYIGHLDLHKIWERSTRRANITLAYSQGFHPMPKIQLASALPLGFSSRAELVDLFTVADMDPHQAQAQLQAAVPSGIHIHSIEVIDPARPPLQVETAASEFEVDISEICPNSDALADLQLRLEHLLIKTSIPRERRGKQYDLRPLIEQAKLEDGEVLRLRLSAREGATGRPEEVLAELGIAFEDTDIERSQIFFRSTEVSL